MAGAGRKTFTRETLLSTEVNDYLMDQTVMRFASAAARTAAIPAPVEGMMSTLDDTNRTERYDGATWRPTSRVAGGKVTTTSDANGLVVVGHGLGAIPKWGVPAIGKQSSAALDSVMKLLAWDDATPPGTATNMYFRTYRHDGTNGVATPFSTAVTFYWSAGLD